MNRKSTRDIVIREVEKVRGIWDKTHSQHHNRYFLQKQWDSIAKLAGITELEARKIWKNVRQEFGKQLAKSMETENSLCDTRPQSDWPYFQNLMFLKSQFLRANNMKPEFVEVKEESQNGEFENSQDVLSEFIDNSTPRFPSESPIAEPANEIKTQEFLKRETNVDIQQTPVEETVNINLSQKRKLNPQQFIGQALLDIEKEKLQLKKQRIENLNDEDIGFFNSLIPHVRALDARKKMLFRMKIQQILFELSFSDVTESTTTQDLYQQSYTSNGDLTELLPAAPSEEILIQTQELPNILPNTILK